MTKRDFFIVIVKLFGLFSLVTSLFSILPNNISLFLIDFDAFATFWLIFTTVSIFILFLPFIFMAGIVVDFLRLDKGFDDDRIEMGNLNSKKLVKLGTILLGGLLLLNNIPVFLGYTFYAFQGSLDDMFFGVIDRFSWIVSGFNILLGLFILMNYRLTGWLLGKNEDEKIEHEF